MSLEPLPETRDAFNSLDRFSGRDLFDALMHQSRQVMVIVPSCVGLSVAMLQHGVTFTLVAAPTELAVLDGIRDAVGGPVIDAVAREEVVVSADGPEGLLNEARWAQFAQVGAAHGVLSTLSMPVHDEGRVIGGVNIYASASDAFRGKQRALAVALGAWAPGATANADLSFASMEQARRAPRVLKDAAVVDHAVGVVVPLLGIDQDLARKVIAQAAVRAGQDEVQIARAFIDAHIGDATTG